MIRLQFVDLSAEMLPLHCICPSMHAETLSLSTSCGGGFLPAHTVGTAALIGILLDESGMS